MKSFLSALRIFVLLSLITGILYPFLITGLASMIFPRQAHGSLITNHEQVVGSSWLAQEFKSPRYFWPRPSSGSYATVPSGASNLGPTSAALKALVTERAVALRQAHGLAADAMVPEELLQASGSGLDPEISPAAARFQMQRVCQARQFDAAQTQQVEALIAKLSEAPQFGFLGEARLNVLRLNLELDAVISEPHAPR